jgi:protoporphyrinogen oxidase
LNKQGGNQNFLILEKESSPFGLMKSFPLWWLRYDIGGHALHNNLGAINFLQQQGISSYQQKRKAYIIYKNKYIPFPFQLHLAYLNLEERIVCYRDFLKAYFTATSSTTIDEHLLHTFWKSIYNLFLYPYNTKLWKTDLKLISTNRKQRISQESFNTIKNWFLHRNTKNYGSNEIVRYPTQWGFEQYLYPFFTKVKWNTLFNQMIISIDPINKTFITNTHQIHYTKLIWLIFKQNAPKEVNK